MRLRRKRALWQAFRARRELHLIQDNTSEIRPNDILLVCTLRNEYVRLPYFLKYYELHEEAERGGPTHRE